MSIKISIKAMGILLVSLLILYAELSHMNNEDLILDTEPKNYFHNNVQNIENQENDHFPDQNNQHIQNQNNPNQNNPNLNNQNQNNPNQNNPNQNNPNQNNPNQNNHNLNNVQNNHVQNQNNQFQIQNNQNQENNTNQNNNNQNNPSQNNHFHNQNNAQTNSLQNNNQNNPNHIQNNVQNQNDPNQNNPNQNNYNQNNNQKDNQVQNQGNPENNNQFQNQNNQNQNPELNIQNNNRETDLNDELLSFGEYADKIEMARKPHQKQQPQNQPHQNQPPNKNNNNQNNNNQNNNNQNNNNQNNNNQNNNNQNNNNQNNNNQNNNNENNENKPNTNDSTEPIRKETKLILRSNYNYASSSCGANIIRHSHRVKHSSEMLIDNPDTYALFPCINNQSKPLWFIIQLCEPINIHSVYLSNLELFSSYIKTFRMSLSNVELSPEDAQWHPLETNFTMKDGVRSQMFSFENSSIASYIYARYIRVEIIEHYNMDFFCPISVIKVFGVSLVDELSGPAIDDDTLPYATSNFKNALFTSDEPFIIDDLLKYYEILKYVKFYEILKYAHYQEIFKYAHYHEILKYAQYLGELLHRGVVLSQNIFDKLIYAMNVIITKSQILSFFKQLLKLLLQRMIPLVNYAFSIIAKIINKLVGVDVYFYLPEFNNMDYFSRNSNGTHAKNFTAQHGNKTKKSNAFEGKDADCTLLTCTLKLRRNPVNRDYCCTMKHLFNETSILRPDCSMCKATRNEFALTTINHLIHFCLLDDFCDFYCINNSTFLKNTSIVTFSQYYATNESDFDSLLVTNQNNMLNENVNNQNDTFNENVNDKLNENVNSQNDKLNENVNKQNDKLNENVNNRNDKLNANVNNQSLATNQTFSNIQILLDTLVNNGALANNQTFDFNLTNVANEILGNKSTIVTETEKLSLNNENLSLNNENLSLNNEKLSLKDEKLSLNNVNLSLNNENLSLDNEKLSLNNEKLTLHNEKLTLDNEKLTLDNEKLVVITNEPQRNLSNSESHLFASSSSAPSSTVASEFPTSIETSNDSTNNTNVQGNTIPKLKDMINARDDSHLGYISRIRKNLTITMQYLDDMSIRFKKALDDVKKQLSKSVDESNNKVNTLVHQYNEVLAWNAFHNNTFLALRDEINKIRHEFTNRRGIYINLSFYDCALIFLYTILGTFIYKLFRQLFLLAFLTALKWSLLKTFVGKICDFYYVYICPPSESASHWNNFTPSPSYMSHSSLLSPLNGSFVDVNKVNGTKYLSVDGTKYFGGADVGRFVGGDSDTKYLSVDGAKYFRADGTKYFGGADVGRFVGGDSAPKYLSVHGKYLSYNDVQHEFPHEFENRIYSERRSYLTPDAFICPKCCSTKLSTTSVDTVDPNISNYKDELISLSRSSKSSCESPPRCDKQFDTIYVIKKEPLSPEKPQSTEKWE